MVRKIILTKGLPGSGKTKWAKEYQKQFNNTVRVNKDDLRDMLHDGLHSKGRENFVLKTRDWLIVAALTGFHDVIVDDTNLHPKHEARIRELITELKPLEVELEIKDFTDVPIDECIKRDLRRERSVGSKVIYQMWNEFIKPKLVIKQNQTFPPAIICDIDGTLAHRGERGIFEFEKCEEDTCNDIIKDIFNSMGLTHTGIILSGREDKFKEETIRWLKKNEIHYDYLYMRKADDIRPDYIIKKELFDTYIKDNFYTHFILDDRQQVVDMWRSLGLTVLQVDYGNF